jgi:hypothetical protein
MLIKVGGHPQKLSSIILKYLATNPQVVQKPNPSSATSILSARIQ